MRFLGIVLLMLCVSWYHPVHVSVCNIDLDPGTGSVELSIKIFADDFQDLILQKYSVQLQITEQINPQEQMDSIHQYVEESLKFRINGKEAGEMQFVEARLNEEAIWLLYSIEHDGQIRKMSIRNTIMLEKFDDQTNLLIVSYNNKDNGYRLDNKTTDLTFSIK